MTRTHIAARLAAVTAALELIDEREALDGQPLALAATALAAQLDLCRLQLVQHDRTGLVAALEQPETEARLILAHGELQSVRADLAADRQRAERRAWDRAAKQAAIAREAGARECHNDWFARLNDDASEPLPAFTYNPED